MNKAKRIAKCLISALILSLILMATVIPVLGATAQEQGRVVRVGWYESPFNSTDEFGRRSGYAYEYQQKIAAYSGWSYEYVTGSWSDLLQMLIDGKIDLMSDISYTEERAEKMLFSSLPMGAEEYYIFIAPNNEEISGDNFSTMNGKKVGINKGSVMIDMYKEWAELSGVTAEIVEVTDELDDALTKLKHGDLDMYVSIDGYFDVSYGVPICKVGESDFYFAVGKDCHDILAELNGAMNRIRSENPHYNHELRTKYLTTSGVNYFLTAEEKTWLSDHGTIKVAYQDNYLAFCAKDPETGELTGALKDYLEYASDCLENAHITFEAVSYPTASAALEAVKNGEADCMFPANLTDYDGEEQGFFMTAPIMRTEMLAVIRESERWVFAKKDRVTVAVNAGNTNYNMFLLDYFPDWRSIFFKDTPECLHAIAEGKADCLLMSNYRFSNISALCDKLRLVGVSTGVAMDYSFAVARKSTTLYSILNKIADVVPDSTVDAALSYYYTEDAKVGFAEFLVQHIGVVIGVFGAVIVVVLFLSLRSAHSYKKALANQKLISATETDEMTGLYIKSFFYEYANRMYREHPDKQMDAIVVNVEQFHSVNAINGREFGDQVIREIADEIRYFVKENGGIGGHAEADHFAIYCPHVEEPHKLFDRLQDRIDMMTSSANIRIRMGIMPWEKDTEPTQLIEQALIACSLARGRYKEHFVVFDENVREREKYEQRLKNDLRRALENREFDIYYQPKYDIRSDEPKLVSAEALVRWNHPDLGMISPGDFIPLFEENGSISSLDKYVWSKTVWQIAEWKKKFGATIPVSVNLSRLDIYDPSLEFTLDTLLRDSGLTPSDLKLEVTESAYTENADQVIGVIEGLRKKGYEIEMDDFGTGYSSLNMLSSMPVNVLKMDRAFVRNIDHDGKEIQMVELILDIAKKLKVPVIAEGVETESQLETLKNLGCDIVQGFYFSRPLPADEFEKTIIKETDAD